MQKYILKGLPKVVFVQEEFDAEDDEHAKKKAERIVTEQKEKNDEEIFVESILYRIDKKKIDTIFQHQ